MRRSSSSMGGRVASLASLALDFETDVRDAAPTLGLWHKLADLDDFVGSRRSKHSGVQVDDGLIIFGGDDGRKMLNDLLRFDVREHSWSRVAMAGIAPSPRYHHSAVVFGKTMFVFGGYTGDLNSNTNLENKNDLHVCQFGGRGQWREIVLDEASGHSAPRPRPRPRSAHGAVVHNSHMYIFGGFDGQDRLNDMWRISCVDPALGWEAVRQEGAVPPTCCNSPTVVAGDHMYAFSGHSGKDTTNALFRFHFPSGVWELVPSAHLLCGGVPPPPRRFGHTMAHHNNHLYVFGGTADNTLPAHFHRFSLATQCWELVPVLPGSTPPSGRCFHSATIADNSLYVFGGTLDFQQNARSNEMFRFQLDSSPPDTLADDLLRVLDNDEQTADTHFVVGSGGKLLAAHAAIVAARSPVLRAEILTARLRLAAALPAADVDSRADGDRDRAAAPAALTPAQITLPGLEPAAFEVALRFMYSDRLMLGARSDPADPAVLLLVLSVYDVAVYCAIRRLEALCVRWIKHSVSAVNVLTTLANVSARCLDHLRDFLLGFCVQEQVYKSLIMSKDFETIPPAILVDMVRRREASVHDRASGKLGLAAGEGVTDDFLHAPLDDPHNLPSDLAALLGESGRDFADVYFVVGETTIAVHKAILIARSTYFQAMFRSGLREAVTSRINISIGDVVPTLPAVESLLRFLYFGGTFMPPEDSLYLFSAPTYFGLSNERLHAMCRRNLEHNVSSRNIFGILEAAHGIGATEMKQRALHIIVRNFGKVGKLPAIRSVSRDLLLEILAALANFMAQAGEALA